MRQARRVRERESRDVDATGWSTVANYDLSPSLFLSPTETRELC